MAISISYSSHNAIMSPCLDDGRNLTEVNLELVFLCLLQHLNCTSSRKLRHKGRKLPFAHLLPMLASLTGSFPGQILCLQSIHLGHDWVTLDLYCEVICFGFLSAYSNALLKALFLCSSKRKNHGAIYGPLGNWGTQNEFYLSYTRLWSRKLRNLLQPLYDRPRSEIFNSWGLAFSQNHNGKWRITSLWDFWKSPEDKGPMVSTQSWFSFIFSPPHIILRSFYPNRCRNPTFDSSGFLCHECS